MSNVVLYALLGVVFLFTIYREIEHGPGVAHLEGGPVGG